MACNEEFIIAFVPWNKLLNLHLRRDKEHDIQEIDNTWRLVSKDQTEHFKHHVRCHVLWKVSQHLDHKLKALWTLVFDCQEKCGFAIISWIDCLHWKGRLGSFEEVISLAQDVLLVNNVNSS